MNPIEKITSDTIRLMQALSLAVLTVVALICVFTAAKFLVFLGLLATAALLFFSLVPPFFFMLGADTEPLSRTGHASLRAGEAAGFAGVAAVIMALLGALDFLIGSRNPLFGEVLLLLAIQALAGIGIAAGVGLTNLLRNGDVQLEAPSLPGVGGGGGTPAVSVGPGYGGQMQGGGPQQPPPQAGGGYPPPGGGYPPQGGGY